MLRFASVVCLFVYSSDIKVYSTKNTRPTMWTKLSAVRTDPTGKISSNFLQLSARVSDRVRNLASLSTHYLSLNFRDDFTRLDGSTYQQQVSKDNQMHGHYLSTSLAAGSLPNRLQVGCDDLQGHLM